MSLWATGLAPGAALAEPERTPPPLEIPPRPDAAPPGYALTAQQAYRIAWQSEVVREESRRHASFVPVAYTRGPDRWQVSWYNGDEEVAQARVDDSSGTLVEAWTGYQVRWEMARGYSGDYGRKLNAPYVWIPLCLLFVLPFVDPRRPFRILHLDLLALLAFSVSHFFFNLGEIGISVRLVYPVLAYLLARLLWAGFHRGRRRERLIPHIPLKWLTAGLVVLGAVHVALNIVDSEPIDVGLASVVGADRLAGGQAIYGVSYNDDVWRGDTYGPLVYLSYVPFEQLLPWRGTWDDLPAARAAAISFDLLTMLALFLLGRRLCGGRRGRELGVGLAWAWATFPYAWFTLMTNSNDALVALLTVVAMLSLTLPVERQRTSAMGRGVAIGLGGAAKIAPLALAPLFATAHRGEGQRSELRRVLLFGATLAAVLAIAYLPLLPDGGLRELYDRTVGFQASRNSPFSVWGQLDSGENIRQALSVAAAGLALLVTFVPRRKGSAQVAALAAAVLIAIEISMAHWFYLYVVWFAPLALVAFMTSYGHPAESIAPQPSTATLRRRRASRPAARGA